MLLTRTPLLRTLRVFGLPSPRGHVLTSFLDKLLITGPIEQIVPNHASRSLDITLFSNIGVTEFLERKRYPSQFDTLKFEIGEESRLPVELMSGLILRNASRALRIAPLMDYMTPDWLTKFLLKFGEVEKLEVNPLERAAVAHYMSINEAIHVRRCTFLLGVSRTDSADALVGCTFHSQSPAT